MKDSLDSIDKLAVRRRRLGHALNAVTVYHFGVCMWLIAWPCRASLWAAVVAWIALPLVGAATWRASEKLMAAMEIEDRARRLREFFRKGLN